MSRRDYVRIAAVMAASFSTADPVSKNAIWCLTLSCLTLSMADTLQADNPAFDRSRFYEAVLGDSDHFAVRDSFQVSA